MDTKQSWAPVILRVGMSLVFLWFGTQQLMNPSMWLGFVPQWASAFASTLTLVTLNGWFEVVFGLSLLVGFQVRIVSILLAIHLFFIAFSVGFDAIGVRDFGLSIATLSIFFAGRDFCSLDSKLKA